MKVLNFQCTILINRNDLTKYAPKIDKLIEINSPIDVGLGINSKAIKIGQIFKFDDLVKGIPSVFMKIGKLFESVI